MLILSAQCRSEKRGEEGTVACPELKNNEHALMGEEGKGGRMRWGSLGWDLEPGMGAPPAAAAESI